MLADLTDLFSRIWGFFDDITIPVIDMKVSTFLLCCMVLSTLILAINLILNKPGGKE